MSRKTTADEDQNAPVVLGFLGTIINVWAGIYSENIKFCDGYMHFQLILNVF